MLFLFFCQIIILSGFFLEGTAAVPASDVDFSLILGYTKHLTAVVTAEIAVVLIHHLGTLLTDTVGNRTSFFHKPRIFTAAFIVVTGQHTHELNNQADIRRINANRTQQSHFKNLEQAGKHQQHQARRCKKQVELVTAITPIHQAGKEITNHRNTPNNLFSLIVSDALEQKEQRTNQVIFFTYHTAGMNKGQ